ncbi:dihydrolipoamide acetyltransferase family protein [Mesorhizobium sp. KR9-304]|uniref:dihydrolipoamide acetyltransferase family protein n=1 Tax=Mesorhizobium sp. KR9-304 TaxID=3156614 RepID=UPI0032B5A684
MATDLLMPKLGLTMTEGVLLEWKARPGDAVAKGQLLYVVETDKIATEVEAEADGILEAQLVADGETVPVGAVVGRLAGAGEAGTTSRQAMPATAEAPIAKSAVAPGLIKAADLPSQQSRNSERIVATPLARRIAKTNSVDLAGLAGSGPRGRIKAIDVEQALSARPASMPATVAGITRSKPSATQAAMARRLVEVKQGVPHFYLSTEIEVTALLALRQTLNADTEAARLTLNHFVLAATGRALRDNPNINRVWADGDLVAFADTDVSMAIETERGLLVPVIRNAGSRPFDAIAADARALVERARSGRLSAADMEGGALAVSNAGMHDVTWVTSIINPGQSAILGVGSVRSLFRPDGDGRPELRRELGIVLSADHRVHTGVEGLAFLSSLKAYLETPMRLLRQT